MRKKIMALFLALTMLFGLVQASVVFAASPTIVFTVTPNVTEAHPGDTVTYTITLKTSENVSGTQFYLNIPVGMTYVAGSGKIDPNLKTTLDNDANEIGEVSYTESLKMFIANTGALEGLNNLSGGVTFGTFQCTVDADASGNIDVGLTIDVLDDGDVNPYPVTAYTVQTTAVSVTAVPKPATGITLNKNTTTIYTGADETLIATVEPSDTTDTVTWTSGNTAVATVDNTGKVHAVAPGTATITATAGDQSDTCLVTVENAPCVHDYTAETKNTDTLKTPGTCKDEAVYYYSCSKCGDIEFNDEHTFLGDKDADNHTGGTETVNAKPADHKNQVDGYTGDIKCLGCGEILTKGSVIPAGEHEASDTWSYDEDGHWKTCCVEGCDDVVVAKTNHSGGTATCQSKAECEICHQPYGSFGDHDFDTEYSFDSTGHWYACKTAGCTQKTEIISHIPDREEATETEPVLCKECGYEITPALGHDVDTEHFESDADNHWNNCANCDEKQNIAPHAFEWVIDKEATATEKGSKHEECTVCGYAKASVDIPATGTEKTETPDTGDANNMLLWGALLLAGGLGVTGTAAYSKKRREDAE